MHVDYSYKVGAPTKCEYEFCCRDWPPSAKQSGSAGFWGDYGCDTPVNAIEGMMKYIAENQDTLKTEFITWTGDNAAHDTWLQNNTYTSDMNTGITSSLTKYIGADKNIAWYPTQGNHDTFPMNQQDFTKPGQNYVINKLKEAWRIPNWLSAEEAESFGQYGHFSKPLPWDSKSKVISINS